VLAAFAPTLHLSDGGGVVRMRRETPDEEPKGVIKIWEIAQWISLASSTPIARAVAQKKAGFIIIRSCADNVCLLILKPQIEAACQNRYDPRSIANSTFPNQRRPGK